MKNHHLAVTEKLIAELERGCAPWVRPWGGSALPMNIATKRLYRGANIISLWLAQQAAGYPSAQWLSYRQAMGLGGCVRKSEHGTPIFFYSSLKEDESEERTRTIPLLRSYTVFNVAQCDGLPAPQPEAEKPIMPEAAGVFAQVEACIAKIGASIHHGGPRAYYSPTSDEIGLPVPESFLAPEHYFATSLHEHAHWSGATTRLAREFGKRFGDAAYAFEELVAELTSAYLCAEFGLPGMLQHPEYLAHWIGVLKADPRALMTAGAKASAAADYLAELGGLREAQSEYADEAVLALA